MFTGVKKIYGLNLNLELHDWSTRSKYRTTCVIGQTFPHVIVISEHLIGPHNV